LSRDEEDEVTLMNETGVSDPVLDCYNFQVVWSPKLPINPRHYDTLVAATIDVSKGKTEHDNVADSLLLIDALQTEFKISSIPEPWVVVSEEDP
jgi:hypothetical protein